jgi:hypothetical protein
MRGALIHYSTNKVIPVIIKNIVFFQFSPESVGRDIVIPSKDLKTETKQAGTEPIEQISFAAHFDAGDLLNQDDLVTKVAGIGPQLAALEKLVYPITAESSAIGFALDKVGDLIPDTKSKSTIPIPRKNYPQILLVWGLTRFLPVDISSLKISELRYDKQLNPIRAEVNITLSVLQENDCMDYIAKGALKATNSLKDSAALLNFGRTGKDLVEGVLGEISDIVPF